MNSKFNSSAVFSLALIVLLGSSGCSMQSQPGPDQTVEGTVLGAGWGAGAGAVIGNQVATAGLGAGAGAGVGAVAGLLTGASFDRMDSNVLREQHALADVSAKTDRNFRSLTEIQDTLDNASLNTSPALFEVYFDADSTSLKGGSLKQLEIIAESFKASAHARKIEIHGNTDDSGNPAYNKNLAEARARSVAEYFQSRGISSTQITIDSSGAQKPIASNSTPQGRQLNRRVEVVVR